MPIFKISYKKLFRLSFTFINFIINIDVELFDKGTLIKTVNVQHNKLVFSVYFVIHLMIQRGEQNKVANSTKF